MHSDWVSGRTCVAEILVATVGPSTIAASAWACSLSIGRDWMIHLSISTRNQSRAHVHIFGRTCTRSLQRMNVDYC